MATQQTFGFLQTPSFRKSRAATEPFTRALDLPAFPARSDPKPAEHPPSPPKPLQSESPPADDRDSILRRLRTQVGCVTTAPLESSESFSTGVDCLDRLLPRGGLRIDGISEWVAQGDGCGAATLSIIAAATHLRSTTGPLIVVGGQGTFYPPAAIALGIPVERIIWVRTTRHADVVWAIDQALRCEMVAAVWAHVGPNLDDRDARRFQLAAEIGSSPGLFVRPSAVRGAPSFAETRFHVAGQNPEADKSPEESMGEERQRLLRITLDRCRGGVIGQSVCVRIDDRARVQEITAGQLDGIAAAVPSLGSTNHETATVRLASELAHPMSAKSTRRRRV